MNDPGDEHNTIQPSVAEVCCPVCGRPSPAQRFSAVARSRKAWGRLAGVLYAHGRCPVCAIVFKKSRVSSKFGIWRRKLSGQPQLYYSAQEHLDESTPTFSPNLPAILARRSSAEQGDQLERVEGSSQQSIPFLLEINNRSIGFHFHLSLGGGNFNRSCLSALGAVAKQSQKLCVEGLNLAKWAADKVAQSQQNILAGGQQVPVKVEEASDKPIEAEALADLISTEEIPGEFMESETFQDFGEDEELAEFPSGKMN